MENAQHFLDAQQLWVLSGILVMVVGLALRFNALLVVIVAGFVTGLAAKMGVREIVTIIGDAFIKNRYMSLFVLVLPVIGLAEHYGLRERAEILIGKLKAVTAGRIFSLYIFIRQCIAGWPPDLYPPADCTDGRSGSAERAAGFQGNTGPHPRPGSRQRKLRQFLRAIAVCRFRRIITN